MVAKVTKFFEEYGIEVIGKSEHRRGHISHARSCYGENWFSISYKGKEYFYIEPAYGTNVYRMADVEEKTLCDGTVLVLGLSQKQFIENAKRYFQ